MLSDVSMLRNLHTLSTLKPSQKLCNSGVVFTTHDIGVYASVFRRWQGEDRHANVTHVQNLFSLAMLRCEVLQLRNTDLHMCHRVEEATRSALEGVDNLASTYRDDVSLTSMLAVIVENVTTFLESTQTIQNQNNAQSGNALRHA